jgi:hypothetical protein
MLNGEGGRKRRFFEQSDRMAMKNGEELSSDDDGC